jgi:hypothetical protein
MNFEIACYLNLFHLILKRALPLNIFVVELDWAWLLTNQYLSLLVSEGIVAVFMKLPDLKPRYLLRKLCGLKPLERFPIQNLWLRRKPTHGSYFYRGSVDLIAQRNARSYVRTWDFAAVLVCLDTVVVQVPGSGPWMFCWMNVKFAFVWLFKHMVQPLAVVMHKPGPSVPDGVLLLRFLRVSNCHLQGFYGIRR